MKVVLFCGGFGTRLQEYSETIPKPMVPIGARPILWHLMKYYAHHGHKDFILCLGRGGDQIKDYFLNYKEEVSNDFTMRRGGIDLSLHTNDVSDWTITFVDTGLTASVGERLRAVQPYLWGEDVFLANYSDGLADLPLDEYVNRFLESGSVAGFACVRPSQSFHIVSVGRSGKVASISPVRSAGLWINGGFFVFRREVFDCLHPGEDLVGAPLQRLIARDRLYAYRHLGFWACMDTFREKQQFDERIIRGETPWMVWDAPPSDGAAEISFPTRRRTGTSHR